MANFILCSPCFAVHLSRKMPAVIQLREEASPILRADNPALLFEMSIAINTGNGTNHAELYVKMGTFLLF